MTQTAPDAAHPITPASIKAAKSAGHFAFIRYLDPGLWDNAAKAEIDMIHAAGLGVGIVSETNPTGAFYFNAEQGLADGRASVAYAKQAGVPSHVHLYRPVDYGVSSGDLTQIGDYAKAYVSQVGIDRAGMYGGFDVMEFLRKSGIVRNRWQTYGWSHSQVSPGIKIYQHLNGQKLGDITVDENYVYDTSGFWMPAQGTPKGVDVVNKTTVKLNGKDFQAIVEGGDTYVLWTALEALPGFSKQKVGNQWQFTVDASQEAVQEVTVQLQNGSTTTFTRKG